MCCACTTLIKSEFTTTNNATLLPRQYLDLHDLNKFNISSVNSNRTVNLPSIAWNPWMDVKKRDDIKALDITFPFGRMPSRFTKYIRHHYYAGTRYTLVKMRSQLRREMIGSCLYFHLFTAIENHAKCSKVYFKLDMPTMQKYSMDRLMSEYSCCPESRGCQQMRLFE